jgi:hypothetical protein
MSLRSDGGVRGKQLEVRTLDSEQSQLVAGSRPLGLTPQTALAWLPEE